MECPHCGAKNAFRARFCRRCAQRLEQTPAADSPAAASAEDGNPTASAGSNNVFLIVALLLLVAFGWYFLRPEKSPSPPASEPPYLSTPLASGPQPAAQTATSAMPAPAMESTIKRESPAAASPPAPSAKPVSKAKPKTRPLAKQAPEKAEPVPESPLSEPAPLPVVPPPAAKPSMAAELEACNTRVFLGKAICVERVRWKFCQGRWGTTPECPKPDGNESGG